MGHTPGVHAVARPSGQPDPTNHPGTAPFARLSGWVGDHGTSNLVFAVLAVLAFAVLLYLGRGLTFFGDEWEFIVGRQDLTIWNLFRPHNEHWSTFPVLVYRALFGLFGLHSYLPYLATLLVVHVTAVAGLFVLVRRAAGPLVALGGAALMLFLGSAHEDLLWAFQIGFLGSVAAGLWALVVIQASVDRRALIATSLLLFVAVASSGIGLFFLVAVGTLALFDPSRRRALLPVAAVSVGYLAWFVAFGRTGLDPSHPPLSWAAIQGIPTTVITGGDRAIGGLLGVAIPANLALVVLLTGAIAWGLIRGQSVPHLAVAAVAGLIAGFVVIALARDQLFSSATVAASAPRYVYPSAAFLLLALAAFLGEAARRSVSWRQGLAVALVVGFCLIGNLSALRQGIRDRQGFAVQLRAAITWVEAHPDSPLVRANVRPTKFTIDAGVADILALASRAGSVTRDDLFPSVVTPPSPAAVDRALFDMVATDLHVRPTSDPVVAPTPPQVTDSHDVTTTPDGGCLSVRSTGPAPRLSIAAPAGEATLFEPDTNGRLTADIGLLADPQDRDSISSDVIAAQRYAIAIPDVGAGVPWTLRLILSAAGPTSRLCSLVIR